MSARAEISFRKARTADRQVIREMFYHAIYVPPGEKRPGKEIVEKPELRKYHSGWPRTGDIGVVAVAGGQGVGATWVRLLAGEERGYGYVDEETPELTIAVLPEYRNRGIGTELLERLEREAAKAYQRICLSVSRGNPAQRLYGRMGFARLTERGNDLVMVKRIAG